VVVVLNYLIPGKLLMVLVAVILSAELITWSSIVVSHLYFGKRVAPHGGKFKALLHPLSNYLFLGYFGLVLVLMTRSMTSGGRRHRLAHLADRAGRSGADTRADQPAKCRAGPPRQQSARLGVPGHTTPTRDNAQERRMST
jgi:hypothetical protein